MPSGAWQRQQPQCHRPSPWPSFSLSGAERSCSPSPEQETVSNSPTAISSTGFSGAKSLRAARGLGRDAREKIRDNPFNSGPCLSDYKQHCCARHLTMAAGGKEHRRKWRLREVVSCPRYQDLNPGLLKPKSTGLGYESLWESDTGRIPM